MRREEVPIPPFQPNATVPVPAPTAPSSTIPSLALAIAARTCSRVTCSPRMSLSDPSLVSPTSALTDRTLSLPGCARVQRTVASSAIPTDNVLVSTIGDSIVPSSSTCVEPASLPNALPTNTAPATFCWNRFPPWGRIAVTPVRMFSPVTIVVWPTRTPPTSVIALFAPGSIDPGAIPRSRARGRDCEAVKTKAFMRTSASSGSDRIGSLIIRAVNIYLACTVRGDRGAVGAARALAGELVSMGHVVLTAHLLDDNVETAESSLTERDVFERDMRWLTEADLLIAEASGSTFGVGFEVGYVLGRSDVTGQRVVLLYQQARRRVVSRLISGNVHPKCTTYSYENADDLLRFIHTFFAPVHEC